MIRTVYHFDDLGRKVPVGSYDDGLKAVGGRLFYIDSNSDETVEFYDAQGNVLSNVGVGDTPAYYKITSAGVSGKDKYYAYQEELYTNKVWTYFDNNGFWIYESTGYTSQDIGAGKISTAGIMALHDGAYITDNAFGYQTIWYTIQQCRSTQLGGCSDWFVGSEAELETLRLFINDNISTLGLVDLFTNRYVLSSSENNTSSVRYWNGSDWSHLNKAMAREVVPIRSF